MATMRARFANPFALLMAKEDFFRELPTQPERRLFGEAFPQEFYELFGFFSHESDDWPASTEYEFRFFKRPADEFFELIAQHPPRCAFDPPDVSGLRFFPDQVEALCLARGHWWQRNGWPMTAAEKEWLKERGKK